MRVQPCGCESSADTRRGRCCESPRARGGKGVGRLKVEPTERLRVPRTGGASGVTSLGASVSSCVGASDLAVSKSRPILLTKRRTDDGALSAGPSNLMCEMRAFCGIGRDGVESDATPRARGCEMRSGMRVASDLISGKVLKYPRRERGCFQCVIYAESPDGSSAQAAQSEEGARQKGMMSERTTEN
eukprot:6188588-Pleurochrysis_carterae.AAC.7